MLHFSGMMSFMMLMFFLGNTAQSWWCRMLTVKYI